MFDFAKPAITNNGLIAYLDAGIKGSYAGSGSVWTDLIKATNMTFSVSPTYDLSNGGNFAFNGSIIATGSTSLLAGASAYCLECWARTTTTASSQVIHSQYSAATNRGWMIFFGTSGKITFDGRDGSYRSLPSTTSYAINTWYHIACTYVSGAWKIYINGVLENSATYSNVTMGGGTSPFTFGARSDASTQNRLFGSVAKVRIYNRALSLAEIQRNFNAERKMFGV